MRSRRRHVVATIAAAAAVALAATAVPAVDAAEIVVRAGGPGARPRTVTLITGDRVTLSPAGQVGIDPSPGRDRIRFIIDTRAGHTSVVPADARPLLRAGRLDPRLFDVTTLMDHGYDRRPDLPLIVTQAAAGSARPGAGRAAARVRPAVPKGLRTVRDLPAANAVAARVARADAAAAWTAIKARGTGATVPTTARTRTTWPGRPATARCRGSIATSATATSRGSRAGTCRSCPAGPA
jgi:hypothetical protein